MTADRGCGTCEHELWRPIPGWEDRYEASDHGHIRSIRRYGVSRSGRVLVGQPDKSGHLAVDLRRVTERKRTSVHRLVLLAFVGPCPPGNEVRHIDGNPSNNHLDNIVCDTRSANTLDRALHRDPARKTPMCRKGHPLVGANLLPVRTRPMDRYCRTCERARRRGAVAA